jgi:hypothetical protein
MNYPNLQHLAFAHCVPPVFLSLNSLSRHSASDGGSTLNPQPVRQRVIDVRAGTAQNSPYRTSHVRPKAFYAACHVRPKAFYVVYAAKVYGKMGNQVSTLRALILAFRP